MADFRIYGSGQKPATTAHGPEEMYRMEYVEGRNHLLASETIKD